MNTTTGCSTRPELDEGTVGSKEQSHRTLLWGLVILVFLKILVEGIEGWTEIAVFVGDVM